MTMYNTYYTALYSIQHYTTLYSTIQHYTALYSTIQHYTVLYSTIQHYTALYNTIQHYTTLYNTALYSHFLEHTVNDGLQNKVEGEEGGRDRKGRIARKGVGRREVEITRTANS